MGYSANGRARRVLERLALGEAYYSDLVEAVGRGALPNKHKLNLLLNAMSRDLLLLREGFVYSIGVNGRGALADMREGHRFTLATPTVRDFARAAA